MDTLRGESVHSAEAGVGGGTAAQSHSKSEAHPIQCAERVAAGLHPPLALCRSLHCCILVCPKTYTNYPSLYKVYVYILKINNTLDPHNCVYEFWKSHNYCEDRKYL